MIDAYQGSRRGAFLKKGRMGQEVPRLFRYVLFQTILRKDDL